jgi:hypothetical protein
LTRWVTAKRRQKLRKFEDDLQVAKKELEQAKAALDGTRRLFEKSSFRGRNWCGTKSPMKATG